MLLIIVGLFTVPLLYLLWISFWQYDPNSFAPTPLTIANYQRFLTDSFYLAALTRTLQLGVVTTLVALAVAYPLALIMVTSSGPVRSLFLTLTLMPLMISVVVRVFGWIVILGNNGLLNNLLLDLGLIDRPLRIVHTMTAVVIGLVQVELPFMVMPIFSALLGVDRAVLEAASTLGANPWRVFRHVILPLSLPGVMAGSALVFSLTVSAFVQPQLLGGSRFFVMTTLMYQSITAVLNWPFGAAIGFLLLFVSLLTLGLFGLLLRRVGRTGIGNAG